MNIDDKLSEVFDLEPIDYKGLRQRTAVIGIQDKQAEFINNDYEHVRFNMRELLVTGKDALCDALEVAKQSESPRAYEVVSTLMKQLSDINAQLLDVHEKHQKITGVSKQQKEQPNQVTNNAIFVGSTNELASMIKNMKTGE